MFRTSLWCVIVLSALLLGAANVSDRAVAGPLALPPRPTPVPTATPSLPDRAVKGSLIHLVVDTTLTGLWTAVEWQDAQGSWHEVDGWQGTLEADHTKTWWVAEADRGTGPFRWVLYDQRGGQSLGRSEAFYLPANNRQVVEIKLTAKR